MLSRLAEFTVRRRRYVLVLSLAFFVTAAVFGGGVAEHLSSGGFEDPNAEAEKARDRLEDEFGTGDANLILLVTAAEGTVDDPAVARAGTDLAQELSQEDFIAEVASYWTLGNAPPLKSKDGTEALVLARIAGDQDEMIDRVEVLAPRYERDGDVVDVEVGGFAPVFEQVGSTIERDLAKAEAVAIPVTMLLLVLVFGSVVAASLPMAVGAIAVVGTFLILRLLAGITEVSIFSLNLTTALGLGMAIDYSLFVVSRYREELHNGLSPHDAVVRTVETAGRTVVISAFTVAASLSALLVFPLSFLRSFAYAGVPVVLLAAAGAVISLPAMLAGLRRNVDKWALFRRHPKEVGEGFWHRVAMAVMRRPGPIAAAVVAFVLVLGVPFLGADFRQPDDRVLPASASTRQVSDKIRTGFDSQEGSALQVAATGIGDPQERTGEIDRYARSLSRLEGVARVDALTGSYVAGDQVFPASPFSARFGSDDGTWLSVVPSVEPMSAEGENLVGEVRDVWRPFPVLVGGPAADLVDSKSSLFGRMPLAAGIVAVVTFTLLFLMFGSLLVPAKAIVLNLLSLSATFGAMVWIFQDGHLSGALDFTATGALDTVTPILMFCIAFGLSMDYEVFLLSRIKEEYDRTGDNVASVAVGLERTGRIVTAAAALLAVVFLAFATSGITFIKLFGIGLTMAVVMDATLIRAVLVPAFMRMAGRANWWAPGWMRRVHQRFGIREAVDIDDELRLMASVQPAEHRR